MYKILDLQYMLTMTLRYFPVKWYFTSFYSYYTLTYTHTLALTIQSRNAVYICYIYSRAVFTEISLIFLDKISIHCQSSTQNMSNKFQDKIIVLWDDNFVD